VGEGDVIFVDRLPMEAGQEVVLDQVLMVGENGISSVGSPLVAGAAVTAKVLEQARSSKIIVFKKKRRKNYRRKLGHRQDLTVLRIIRIAGEGGKKLTSGAKVEVVKKPAGERALEKKVAAQGKAHKKTTVEKASVKKAVSKTKVVKELTREKPRDKKASDQKASAKKAAPKKASPKRAGVDEKSTGKSSNKPAAKSKKSS